MSVNTYTSSGILCVCVHVNAFMWVCLCIHVSMFLWMCLHVCIHVCLCECKYMYVDVFMWMCVCLCVCLYLDFQVPVPLCLCASMPLSLLLPPPMCVCERERERESKCVINGIYGGQRIFSGLTLTSYLVGPGLKLWFSSRMVAAFTFWGISLASFKVIFICFNRLWKCHHSETLMAILYGSTLRLQTLAWFD